MKGAAKTPRHCEAEELARCLNLAQGVFETASEIFLLHFPSVFHFDIKAGKILVNSPI
jgi:hypothetical protein